MFELAAGGTGGGLGTFVPLILMGAIFYFLLLRPQQKRQKQRGAMLAAIKVGDRIVTIGGLHGTIIELYDNTIRMEIGEDMKVTVDRQAINQVMAVEY